MLDPDRPQAIAEVQNNRSAGCNRVETPARSSGIIVWNGLIHHARAQLDRLEYKAKAYRLIFQLR
jgi:hypothetical protein